MKIIRRIHNGELPLFIFYYPHLQLHGEGGCQPVHGQEVKNYVRQLKAKCKPRDTTIIVQMDLGSSKDFDADYYSMVLKRHIVFESDSTFLRDSSTRAYVQQRNLTRGSTFFKDFSTSLIKLDNVGTLTGRAGEIRKKCAFVN
ncbi:hypothetical protein CDL15_Pgr002740 [Punica granatum]|uniref:peroxidase n=1 Tax=Punica granatum TaxID=22663 RepID=A0A218X0X1_PUNGR|nr:hypothetical protein CDL15_Pgr002740 [Punica granatum]PKI68606.1 hypothetical protein CRG98_011010 [Punica granatum]